MTFRVREDRMNDKKSPNSSPHYLAGIALVLGLALSDQCAAQSFAIGDDQPATSVYSRGSVISVDSDSDYQDPTIARLPDTVGRNKGFPSLTLRSGDEATRNKDSDSSTDTHLAAPAITVTSSLAVVLGLFAALVWIFRKYGSKALRSGAIPNEVMQSLGSTAIDPRTRVSLIRVGSKLLVVAQSASGIVPLSEITDSDEVRRLTAMCQGNSKQEFASTLQSIEQEPAVGFVDPPNPSPHNQSAHNSSSRPSTTSQPRRRGQLFATA